MDTILLRNIFLLLCILIFLFDDILGTYITEIVNRLLISNSDNFVYLSIIYNIGTYCLYWSYIILVCIPYLHNIYFINFFFKFRLDIVFNCLIKIVFITYIIYYEIQHFIKYLNV